MDVQNRQLGGYPPDRLDDRFAEKNESRGVIIVRLATLTINSCAIKKFVTADEEQLHAPWAAAFQVPRNVNRIADLYLDSDTGVLFSERAVLLNFPVERQSDADLMATVSQRARQRIHDIYQRAWPSHRRSFGAAHQNSHTVL